MIKKTLSYIRNKLFRRKERISNKIHSKIDSGTIVGDYSYIGFNCSITKSHIGRYVSIANNVSIGQGEHLVDEISTNSLFYENAFEVLTKKDVKIYDDVWLGVNSVIMRGVTIGRGAIIGASAVVTKDIPPYAIAVGVPAKVIRYRFTKEQISKIENSKWWNYPPDIAKTFFKKIKLNC